MPTDLAALLVEEGSVSAEDLERASARQREAGGALDTALLELELLPESVLTAALSRASGLPVALPSAWEAGDPRARRVFPSRVAERHGLAPFALEGRELALVATNPVDLGLLDEISFMLSLHLTAHVGPEWRVRTLIHRLYGGTLDPRFAALAARAGEQVEAPPEAPVAAPASAGTEPSFAAPQPADDETSFADEPPPRARPRGFARDAAEPLEPLAAALAQALESEDLAGLFEDEPPEPPAPADPAAPGAEASTETEPEPEPEPTAPPDRRAPPRWSLDDARAALAAARDRDAVVLAALRYARDFFEFAAMFAVTRDAVAGHDALGRDPDARELCRGVAIYASDPGIFRTVIEISAPHLGPIPREAPGNAAILDGLGRETPRTALVYPVLLLNRPVCLVYADNGEAPVSPRRLGDLLLLLSIVGPAFERILRDRKRRRRRRAAEAPPSEVEAPPAAPEPAPEPPAPELAPVEAPPPADAGWSTVEPAAVAPSEPTPAEAPTAPAEEESWFVADAVPVPPPPAEAPPAPEALSEDDIDVDVDPPPAEVGAPEQPLALRQAQGERTEESVRVPRPEPSARGEPVEPRAPDTAPVAAPAPAPQDAAGWVDALARSAAGSPERREALKRLLTDPTEALRALCAALPGPSDPAVQDALGALGPVAAAVAAFGSRAVPPLLAVAQDPDPVRRRAAVVILAAAGDPAAYPALADRALDPDPAVSDAAAEGLGAHRRDPGMRAIPEKLRRALLSGLSSRASGAARALGALRDVDAIPLLVQVLDGPDRATAEAAGAALARITLQRHGSDPRAWLAWWKQNRGRGRAEWLFSGLTNPEREVRVTAAAELSDAAAPPVTYSPDADPEERENAARTWAGWWARSGQVL